MQILRAVTYHFLVYACLLCCINSCAQAQAPTREYQIKAAFLFNFTHFVDWPPTAFPSAQAPMVIGVIGKDPLILHLEQTIAGEKLNEHVLIAKKYSAGDEIESCHILFIDENETAHIIAKLKGRSVLTVGETPEFLAAGGMIRFYTRDNKLQLQVNLEAMKAVGLVISSRLLRQVEIYKQKAKG
jgi:hypothetical protein